ncbi:MAG: serine protease [Rubrivivax sp.]|nr:serine protease [Rubrivivax sp.]
MIDSLLLTAARISTFEHDRPLTNASGFFFQRDERLFLVTSRHVLIDEPTEHHPNRIEIEIHTDVDDLARSIGLSMMLFEDGKSQWRQGRDAAGEIDVAVLQIDRDALPENAVIHPFTPDHIQSADKAVEVGSSVLIVGFPLGFHDTLHHLPVVRQAVVASAYGLRFQGQGYFLTDARTHRGTSGAPVVLREHTPPHEATEDDGALQPSLPWRLLGVHSASLDMSGRDKVQDETLGLNCAWYADVLMVLTAADD